MACNMWTQERAAESVRVNLKGEALSCIINSSRPKTTWLELKEILQGHFRPAGCESRYQAELQSRRRHKGETLAHYATELSQLSRLAFPGQSETDYVQKILVDTFTKGQGADQFKAMGPYIRCKSLQAAVSLATEVDSSFGTSSYEKAHKPVVRKFDEQRASDESQEVLVARLGKLVQRQSTDEMGELLGAAISKLEVSKAPERSSSRNVTWRAPSRSPSRGRTTSRSPNRDLSGIKCHRCSGWGHYARDCASRSQYGPEGSQLGRSDNGERRQRPPPVSSNDRGGPGRPPPVSSNDRGGPGRPPPPPRQPMA